MYTTSKVDDATLMYWFIMAPYPNPPFGSCAIYFHYGEIERASSFFGYEGNNLEYLTVECGGGGKVDAIAEDSRRAWIMGIICRVEVFVNVGVLSETIWIALEELQLMTKFGLTHLAY